MPLGQSAFPSYRCFDAATTRSRSRSKQDLGLLLQRLLRSLLSVCYWTSQKTMVWRMDCLELALKLQAPGPPLGTPNRKGLIYNIPRNLGMNRYRKAHRAGKLLIRNGNVSKFYTPDLASQSTYLDQARFHKEYLPTMPPSRFLPRIPHWYTD